MLKEKYMFEDFVEIMKLLRSENGCPWDREQTHQSLKKYLIEETYEVLEVIDANDNAKLCDELGDVLLQVVFHAQIASENGEFEIDDVISGVCKKMISRHTHIFGDDKIDTAAGVLQNWEALKKKEKGFSSHASVLKDVPVSLPSLMRSYKVQQKAAQVGFDWDSAEDVMEKLDEEVLELKEAYTSKNFDRINDELGDAFFTLVNLSRFLKVQPELVLTKTTNKFIKRFEYVEAESAKIGKKLEEMSLIEMDVFWNEAKKFD